MATGTAAGKGRPTPPLNPSARREGRVVVDGNSRDRGMGQKTLESSPTYSVYSSLKYIIDLTSNQVKTVPMSGELAYGDFTASVTPFFYLFFKQTNNTKKPIGLRVPEFVLNTLFYRWRAKTKLYIIIRFVIVLSKLIRTTFSL